MFDWLLRGTSFGVRMSFQPLPTQPAPDAPIELTLTEVEYTPAPDAPIELALSEIEY